MNSPSWLSAFPFIESQWDYVQAISSTYPCLGDYDLFEDWHRFCGFNTAQNKPLDWFSLLRSYRKSRLAYLAYHDLLLPVEQHLLTMQKVADLADVLIQKAHQLASQELSKKHGQVIDDKGQPMDLVIWALGKLGTRELNYSSDVDLVFLYPCEGVSNGKRPLDASSYFTRLGQRVVKLLDHFTQDGRVYRVDMRLRPFGSAGPLVSSFAAFGQYLQYEGREWERFAWMRARQLVGSSADTVSLHNDLNAFIYRKHLDYSVFNALLRIKTEIADHSDASADDLKHGVGGIRAVEFMVQGLQLVFGGRDKTLQGVSIADQLERLINAGKLSADGGAQLKQAWLWLRKIENICQCVADQATHQIPDQISENQLFSNTLADSFGFNSWDQMQPMLENMRTVVDVQFKGLFEPQEQSVNTQSNKTQILKKKQRQCLQQWIHELANKKLPAHRQQQVEQLLHNALALAPINVATEFFELVKKILTRSSYVLMLLKETQLLQSLLKLIGKNSYFISILQRHPVLLEQLFERQQWQLLDEKELQKCWQFKATTEVEEWMEAIRCFKLEQQFNLILAWSEGQINSQQTQQQLTQLAIFIVSQVVRYSHSQVMMKMDGIDMAVDQLLVVAYGSAATEQMTVTSDLDLVFILDADGSCGHQRSADHQSHTEDEILSHEARLFAHKWVRKIINHLTTVMYHDKLYDLDMQLRPNGNAGALVTTWLEFGEYQTKQAWVWEQAALIKSRAIYASQTQAESFSRFRNEVLCQQRDGQEVDQAMRAMSAKLSKIHQQKNEKNHQVEFEVLAAVLKYSNSFPQLANTLKPGELWAQLVELGLVDAVGVVDFVQKKDPTL